MHYKEVGFCRNSKYTRFWVQHVQSSVRRDFDPYLLNQLHAFTFHSLSRHLFKATCKYNSRFPDWMRGEWVRFAEKGNSCVILSTYCPLAVPCLTLFSVCSQGQRPSFWEIPVPPGSLSPEGEHTAWCVQWYDHLSSTHEPLERTRWQCTWWQWQWPRVGCIDRLLTQQTIPKHATHKPYKSYSS